MSVNSRSIRLSNSRVRQIAGNILIYLVGFGLLASSTAKFAHLPPVVAQLTAAGFGGEKIILVASLELISALLLLFPSTRSIGIPFASAFLGGAIATHVQQGEYSGAFAPGLFVFLCWLAAWLRYPEMLWSFHRPRQRER